MLRKFFPWRDWSLTTQITLPLITIALVMIVLASWYSEAINRADLFAATRAQNLQRARGTAQVIDAMLDGVLADVQLLVLDASVVAFAQAPQDTARRAAALLKLQHTQIVQKYDVLAVTNHSGTVILATSDVLLGRNYLTAPYFRSASAGRAGFDEPRYDLQDAQVYLHFSAPILEQQGRLLGVLIGRISMLDLDRQIAADTDYAGRGDYGVLWNDLGIRLSHGLHPGQRFKPLAPLGADVRAPLTYDARYGPATATLLRDASNAPDLLTRSKLLLYDPATDPQLTVSFDPAETLHVALVPLDNQRWVYGIFTPEAGILADAQQHTDRARLAASAALALAILFAVWMGRRIAHPLRRVAETANALAAGDMTRRVRLQQHDEVGKLADAFDAMADALAVKETQLRDHAQDLERRVAERTVALRESETKYRTLVERIPAVTYISALDEASTGLYVSPQIETLLGFPLATWHADARLWEKQVHPADRAQVFAKLAHMRATGQALHAEYRMLKRDGSLVWIQDDAAVVRDETGKPLFLQGVMLDITDRVRAEMHVRQSEEKYRGLMDNASDAILLMDDQGNVVDVNRRTETLLNYSKAELLGKPLMQLALVEETPRVHEAFYQIVAQGTGRLSDVMLLRRDGKRVPVEISGSVIEMGAERIVQGIVHDMTEQKQREHELRVMVAFTTALRSASTRQEMLPIILEQACLFVHAEGAALALLEPIAGDMVFEAEFGAWQNWRGLRIPSGTGISHEVLVTGQPYVTSDIVHDPRMYFADRVGELRAMICVPLISQREPVGALWLGQHAPFEDSDLKLLLAIADIAANAIHRITLHEQTERRAEQLAAVNLLGRALAEMLDLTQIYERVVQTTRQLLPDIAAVFISLFDAERELLICAYGYNDGVVLDGAQLPALRLEPPGKGMQSEVIRTRAPLIVNDLVGSLHRLSTYYHIGAPGVETRSALYVPMLVKSRVLGVVQVQSYTLNRFSQADAELLSVVANATAVAIENARLFNQVQDNVQRLMVLRTVDQAITASLDLRVTLNVLLDQVSSHLRVDAAAVMLFNPHTQTLDYAAGRGLPNLHDQAQVWLGEGLAGRVALERRTLAIPDLTQNPDSSARAKTLVREGLVTYFGVPLIAKGQIKGVLEVFHRTPLPASPEWIEFFESLALQTAIAIDNATLFEGLQRSNLELSLATDATIEGWSHALELRDRETEGHTQRVAELTLRLARAMGVSESELVHLRRGALLHDIGKMGIPDSILLKAGPLTQDEWIVMRKHPVYAYELLLRVDFLRQALDIPYYHHEKWDGTGYPQGLSGEQIPFAARLFAIVDVWDALSSDRPYSKAWSRARILDYLQEQAGRHFDPRVVQAFIEIVHQA